MEPTRRWGGWKVAVPAVVVLVVLGVVAVSCSGGSGTTAATAGTVGPRSSKTSSGAGPDADDVAALSDPGTTAPADGSTASTTTAPVDGSGSGPGGSGSGDLGGSGGPSGSPVPLPPLATADCAAVAQIVIPAARIITEDDFVPNADPPPLAGSEESRLDAVRRVVAVVPAAHRAAWEAVAGDVARAETAGTPATDEDRARLQAARNGDEVWARAVCPGAPPSWQCDHFGSMGGRPDVAPTRSAGATPEAVLRPAAGSDRAIEQQRTDDTVLYVWTDDAGFVTRTQQIERVGDGWATARRHICHSDP